MTGMKKAEDPEELVIRLVEVEGKEKEFSSLFPKTFGLSGKSILSKCR